MSDAALDVAVMPLINSGQVGLEKTVKGFMAGCFAGICECIVGHPLDTLKVRMQTNPGVGLATLASSTLKKEGPLAFYRGVETRIVGLAITNSVLFGVNQELKRRLNVDNSKPLSSMFILAAASTGFVEAFVYTPVDLIKTRMQIQYGRTVAMTPMSAAKDMIAQHGLKGLFQGFGPTALREVVGNSIYFVAYELSKRRMMKWADVDRPTTAMIASSGGIAGTMYWTICLPIDVVKSIVQAGGGVGEVGGIKRKGAFEIALQVYRDNGIRGLYRGLTPSLLRAFPTYSATFLAFEFATNVLDPGASFEH